MKDSRDVFIRSGITISDILIGSKEEIVNKINKHENNNRAYIYLFCKILHRAIERLLLERKRFEMNSKGCYIDICYHNEEYTRKKLHDLGSSSGIDLIKTNFTSYSVELQTTSRLVINKTKIHLGGTLRKTMLSVFNSGDNIYTKEVLTLKNLLEEFKLDYLTEKELYSFIHRGLKHIENAIRNGCSVRISCREENLYMYIGDLHIRPYDHKYELLKYLVSRDRYLHILKGDYKCEYYMLVTYKRLVEIAIRNKKSMSKLYINNAFLSSGLSCTLLFQPCYVLKVKIKTRLKRFIKFRSERNIKFSDVEYIGYYENDKLNVATFTLKQILKLLVKNESGDKKYIQSRIK